MKSQLTGNRWLVALVLASAPLLAGAWSFSYPNDGQTVSTSAQGSGSADPSVTVRYEIVLPDGTTVDDYIVGTSNSSGGWQMTIAGPLQRGAGHTANLNDGGGNIKDTSANITVQ